MRSHMFDFKKLTLYALLLSIMVFLGSTVTAQDLVGSLSLKTVPVPGPSDALLLQFVKNKKAAIELGKAFFWDSRVGSDNKTACASCHFNAGTDNRTKNQIDPGLLRLFPTLVGGNPGHTFQLGGNPNYTLKPGDFPFTKHVDVNNAATRYSDISNVASSQGVFTNIFKDIVGTGQNAIDACNSVSDAVFNHGDGYNINGINTRRVADRNTPTVINAVFNFRNFWDGRANNVFNGSDPFGLRNITPLIWKLENGILRQVNIFLPSSSLASQASGPPLSGTEMSCRGRSFARLGQKLIGQMILSDQVISSNDSVLGAYANGRPKYGELIKKAFQNEYWQSSSIVKFTKIHAKSIGSMDIDDSHPFDDHPDVDVSQMEANFSLFFSLAVQLYEATLIADDTPFDQYIEGKPTLSQQQINGLAIFQGKGRCINCHSGAELTAASFRNVTNKRLEKMVMGDGTIKTYDAGFYNIGVRPTADDIGIGGTDPFGNPLSETLMTANNLTALLGNNFDVTKYTVPNKNAVNVNGAFKTPGLRNVELTGPYFHNGGKATLMQVVEFYNRGGDFGKENIDNLDPDIQPLYLLQSEKENLVAFLVSLTDERVRFEKSPFDHPSLCMPHGQPGNTIAITNSGNGNATDVNPLLCIREVGAAGRATPILPFFGKTGPG